jgi:Ca2+-binding RTX toxin-like protein
MTMAKANLLRTLMVLVVLATALVLFAVLASTAPPSRAADTALTCFGRQPTMPGTIGTSGDDVLIGSSGIDSIAGLGGNDRICSLEGNDFVSGGLGDDRVDAGPGNDIAGGDLGTVDTRVDPTTTSGFGADGGDDLLILGPGNDGSTADHFRPSEGVVSGDGGNDTIDGGRGSDSIWGDH